MVNRRTFLAVAAAAGTASSSPKLAVDGGAPVREKPLRAGFYGTQYYDDKEKQELLEVLETRRPFRWYGPGNEPPKKVMTFEKEFAARMQTKYALAVTSGTAALQCAVAGMGIGPGDEVIVPAWTWHSCFNAVVLAGALPVIAEIDETLNIDPEDFERKITPQTKAVMAVHLQGNPCDMDRVMAVARKHRILVLEDCAQSVGASYKGKPLGSLGDISIYSLQLNKTITAGEGGAVVSNNPELFERAARYHDLGGLRNVHEDWLGGKRLDWFIGSGYRVNEFTGGVLLAQVRKLDTIVNAVRGNARRVYDGIRDLPNLRLRKLPDPDGELGSSVFIEFKTKEQRERFLAAMKAENVPASPPGGSVILPIQPHIEKKITVHPNWPSFNTERGRAIQYGAASCPRTIDILNRFGGVTMDPKFTKRDCDDVIAAIQKVYPAVVGA
ncbi:MAG TPA: DegT/DnrJ/EryC1/StrS family aminotransferase [Bryobacteraceae bacterium]|nr:DegT/DnrJ/EryC1/StrS family aminotransferase [Bryobacteraceae bacterium]